MIDNDNNDYNSDNNSNNNNNNHDNHDNHSNNKNDNIIPHVCVISASNVCSFFRQDHRGMDPEDQNITQHRRKRMEPRYPLVN